MNEEVEKKDYIVVRIHNNPDHPEWNEPGNETVMFSVKGKDLEDAIKAVEEKYPSFIHLGEGNFKSLGGDFQLRKATPQPTEV